MSALVAYSDGDGEENDGRKKPDANYDDVGMDMSSEEEANGFADGRTAELFGSKEDYEAYRQQFKACEKKSEPCSVEPSEYGGRSPKGPSEHGSLEPNVGENEYGGTVPQPANRKPENKESEKKKASSGDGDGFMSRREVLAARGLPKREDAFPGANAEAMKKCGEKEQASGGDGGLFRGRREALASAVQEPSQKGAASSRVEVDVRSLPRRDSTSSRHDSTSPSSHDQHGKEGRVKKDRRRSRSREGRRRRRKSRSRSHSSSRSRSRSRSRDRNRHHWKDRRHRHHRRDRKQHRRHRDHRREREERHREERERQEQRNRKLVSLGLTSQAVLDAAAAAGTESARNRSSYSGGSSRDQEGVAQRAQEIVSKQMEAQVAKVKEITGVDLPKYYNPGAINPLKYAEQIKKRQMLWGSKKEDGKEEGKDPAPTSSNSQDPRLDERPANSSLCPPVLPRGLGLQLKGTQDTSFNKWETTNFGDSQANEKFRRLMGIKSTAAVSAAAASTSAACTNNAKMFEEQEQQYERARTLTHTQRGLGLGFSSGGASNHSESNASSGLGHFVKKL